MRARRILLVDDEFQTLQAAKRLLKDHQTYIASDSASALDVARRIKPDVAVVDVLLGEENGLDLIPSLLQEAPRPVVVVISALSSGSVIHDAYAAGAQACVQKIDLPLLPQILQKLLKD